MSEALKLTLYRNSRNAVVGDLYHDGQRIFACSEPATLAAALYAMQARAFTFASPHGTGEFSFPLADGEFESLAMMLGDRKEWGFMRLFAGYTHLDYVGAHRDHPWVETNWRTACVVLEPTGLVTLRPSTPAPRGFAKILRERDKYIYHPWDD